VGDTKAWSHIPVKINFDSCFLLIPHFSVQQMLGPRYPSIPPEKLTPEQRVFHDGMMEKIRNGFGSPLASAYNWPYEQILTKFAGLP
jgi:hypothetical protein